MCSGAGCDCSGHETVTQAGGNSGQSHPAATKAARQAVRSRRGVRGARLVPETASERTQVLRSVRGACGHAGRGRQGVEIPCSPAASRSRGGCVPRSSSRSTWPTRFAGEVMHETGRSFITPFDRGDIEELIGSMNDAIDQMRKTAKAIALYEVERFEPDMAELGLVVVQASERVARLLPMLRDIKKNAVAIRALAKRSARSRNVPMCFTAREAEGAVQGASRRRSDKASSSAPRSTTISKKWSTGWRTSPSGSSASCSNISGRRAVDLRRRHLPDLPDRRRPSVRLPERPARRREFDRDHRLDAGPAAALGGFSGQPSSISSPSCSSACVAQTVGSGIIQAAIVDDRGDFRGVDGAIAWNVVTWIAGIPSSSSHALIGGLVGAESSPRRASPRSSGWGLGKTFVAIFMSPAIGFALALLLVLFVSWSFLQSGADQGGPSRSLQFVSASLYSSATVPMTRRRPW